MVEAKHFNCLTGHWKANPATARRAYAASREPIPLCLNHLNTILNIETDFKTFKITILHK